MKIESRGYEGKINPHVVTIIAAALFMAGLISVTLYMNSAQAQANSLISKAGTSIDEADYDNAITDLKGAYALDPGNPEANQIIASYLMLILDKAEETQIPEKKKWIASFVRTFESKDPVFSAVLQRADDLIDEADKKMASTPYVEKAEALFDKGEYNSAATEYDNALKKGAKKEDIAPKYDLNCAYLKIRDMAAASDRTGIVDYMNSSSFDCIKEKLKEKRIINISNERYLVISKRKDDYLITYGTFDEENTGCGAGMMSCSGNNAIYEGEWKYGAPDGYGKLIIWDTNKKVSEAEVISGILEKGKFDGDIYYSAKDMPETLIPSKKKEDTQDTKDKKKNKDADTKEEGAEGAEEKDYLAGVPIFGDEANVNDLHALAESARADDKKQQEESPKSKKSKKKEAEEQEEQTDIFTTFPSMDVFDATIWPVQNTPFGFEGEDLKAGALAAGAPARIIAEKGDKFYVRSGEKKGFVKKSECLINLPEVMQKETMYDITNSYSSIYKIKEKWIRGVTGETYYPYVKQDNERYLVPLLYPVAKNFYEAEEYAIEQGLTFRIDDAYQPNSVTKTLYTDTNDFLKDSEELSSFLKDGDTKLQDFLPEGESPHNYGTALDLTLVEISTGNELSMQTPMHEISPLSFSGNNTKDADKLKDIMEKYGFSSTDTMWWEFDIKDMRQNQATFQVMPYSERH